MTRWARLLVIMVAALSWISFGSNRATAQTESNDVELVGLVEALGTDTIVVNGWLIRTTGSEINTALELNMAVKVEGQLQSDASILAREVNVADEGLMPGEVEIVGQLGNMDSSTINVGGMLFSVEGTDFKDSVQTSDWIKFHASLSPEGLWLVREVERFVDDEDSTRPAGEIEFAGTLDEINAASIVVSGQAINIDNTEIRGRLVPGTLVRVHASLNASDQLIAREVSAFTRIQQEQTAPSTGEFELVGVLGEVGNNTIVVSGQTISTAGAEIKSMLTVGMGVKVYVSVVNGELAAREVEAFVAGSDNLNGNANVNTNTNANVNTNGNDNISGNTNSNDNVDDHGGDDNSGNTNSNDNVDDHGGDDNSGSGGGSDDDSGSDDNSGGGNDDSSGDDNSGSDDHGSDDNSGSGGGSDDSGGDDD